MTTTRHTPRIITSDRYTIDLEQGTVSFVLDPDTRETQTESLADLLDTLMWLKRREKELHRFVFSTYPQDDYYQRMHLVNGFYIGRALEKIQGLAGERVNLLPVKIKAEVFEEALSRVEHVVRRNWAEEINEKRANYIPVWDALGKDLNAEQRQLVREEDAPQNLIYEAQARLWTPEYWYHSEVNLERDKPVKLP